MKHIIAIIAVLGFTACCPVRGPEGDAGAQGPAGQPGQDADPITAVQLCPGLSHHRNRATTALCINKQLYAVYGKRGGYLVLMAEGSYRASATGVACNLIVHANCVVSP